MGCNLCGGARCETVEEAAGTRVLRCACGLVFLAPQPARAAIEQTYDDHYYAAWEGEARRRARIWRRRLGRVRAFAPPPGRLLDVGCATGTFLRLARRAGWEVMGTELSPAGAQAAAAEGLAVFTGEIWDAGLPPDTFDVVTCWHVIEHVTDPRRVMDEMHRVLRPGGCLVLATPNVDDRIFQKAYRLARGRRPRLYEPGERELHLYFFSAHTLRRLATDSGFQVVHLGFDRGAAAGLGKQVVNTIALLWFGLSRRNWGMALELVARKPGAGLSWAG